jgi:hypothetical protein
MVRAFERALFDAGAFGSRELQQDETHEGQNRQDEPEREGDKLRACR